MRISDWSSDVCSSDLDGFLLQITTQSKKPPAGVFKSELHTARDVRDGKLRLPLLPVLYELPPALAQDGGWKDPKYWGLVNPNLGSSVERRGGKEGVSTCRFRW